MSHTERRRRRHPRLALDKWRKGHRWIFYQRPIFETLEARWVLSAPSVTSVLPLANSHVAALDSEISATYDQAIDPTSVTAQRFVVHGMQSGQLLDARDTFRVTGDTVSVVPSEPFHPGELVQVIATTRVENSDGERPDDPLVWQFRTTVQGGTGLFDDGGPSFGDSDSHSLATGDFDGDGDVDVFVGHEYHRNEVNMNRVWLNDGRGSFTDSGQSLGEAGRHVAVGDLDGDGDLDVFILRSSNNVLLNDGSGRFDTASQSLDNLDGSSVALGDLDGDGDLDAFVGREKPLPNSVWLNDGRGAFADSGQRLGRLRTGAVALGDLDDDGDLDAFVGNSNQVNRPNKVWLNDGSGVFTDSRQRLGDSDTSAVVLGDLDNDGDLDALVGSGTSNGRSTGVWLNDGSGNFADNGQRLGRRSSAAALGDLDGDGDLDAWIGSREYPPRGDKVWLNDGSGNFSDSGQNLGSSGTNALAMGDVDGDGDLDVLTANWSGDYAPRHTTFTLWRNADFAADLSVTNTNGQHFATPGQTTTYTITVANHGPENVTVATVTDTFPEELTDAHWTCTASPGSSCTASGVGDVSDTVSLLADGTATYTATGTFETFAIGEKISNVATVADPNGLQDVLASNNTATDTDVVAPVVQPLFNSHVADPTTEVSASFFEAVDPSSVDSESFTVHGMQTGQLLAPPNTLGAQGETITISPAQAFHAGELVEVSSTAGVRNAGGGEVNSSFVWQFRAGTSGGAGWFSDSGQMLGSPMGLTNGVALGDLDSDGDDDAFVANGGIVAGDPNHVWLNDGQGTFSHSGQTLGNSRSMAVALGDLDGDGDLDAFVANGGFDAFVADGGSVPEANHVWLNDGQGNFRDSGQNLGNSFSFDVELGDLDGDGDLDAFVANGGPDKVWMNVGDGIFEDSGQSIGNSSNSAAALGDLDGDGDLDVFVANRENANTVWLNDGNGVFQDTGRSLGNSSSRAVALGDLDGDGDLDAFLANANDHPDRVWFNDGQGGFRDSGQRLGGSGRFQSRAVALGDLDGDGDLDAFVANDAEPNWVWRNDGAGKFSIDQDDLGSSRSLAVALGDLDGDGDLDAFVGNGTTFWSRRGESNAVWMNDGTAYFALSNQILGSPNRAVSLGDLDGDGDLDAVVGNGSADRDGVPDEVWLNDGQGTLRDSGQRLGDSNTLAVALGDVDGDGDLDIFAGSEEGQPNRVWLNDGQGTFRDSGQALDAALIGRAVVLGDLDGDGDLDAFVGNGRSYTDQPNTVWLNDGQGVFHDSGQKLGHSASAAVALGDLDGDGDLDAFVGNARPCSNNDSCGPNTVWLNDGEGRFRDSDQRLGNVGSFALALGDLDGDGDLDAFVGNHNYFHSQPVGHPNSVWINDGRGQFADSGQRWIEGDEWGDLSASFAVVLGDLDGDGDLDAYEGNGSYSEVPANRVWLNDGQGRFRESEQSLGDAASRAVALGDLDGDGDLDALVANDSQSNRVWLNADTVLDLSVTNTNDAGLARPGQITTYTITVTNHGPEDVVGAKVTDVFPAQITNVSWTCVAATGSSCTAHGVGDIRDSVFLTVEGTVTYAATGTVDATASGGITNEATVETPIDVADDKPRNNTDIDTVGVVGDAVWDGKTPIGQVGDGRTWGDANNWTVNGIPDRLPADGPRGDDITFKAGSAGERIDLGGDRTVNSVTFQSGYVLTGNTLAITSGDVTVQKHVTATFNSDISRANDLAKRGDGTLVIEGRAGDTVAESGTLVVEGTAGDIVVVSGTLVVEGTVRDIVVVSGTAAMDGSAQDTIVETGTLKGTGSLRTLSVHQGGTFSPGGDSTGTLTSRRSTTIAGTMRADLDTGTDLLNARGVVTLWATLQLRAIGSLGAVGEAHRRIIISESEVLGRFTAAPTIGEHLGFGVFTADIAGTGVAIGYLRQSVMVGLFQAALGDANGDRSFDQLDIVQILQGIKYLTGQPADWTQGDFNGDGQFNQVDIVSALQTGNYLQGPYASLGVT